MSIEVFMTTQTTINALIAERTVDMMRTHGVVELKVLNHYLRQGLGRDNVEVLAWDDISFEPEGKKVRILATGLYRETKQTQITLS